MPRYLLFRSGELALVANPHTLDITPTRWAGRRLRATPPLPKQGPDDVHPDLIDFYEPCEEILLDDPHLRSAAKAGDGEILAIVEARSLALAEPLLRAAVAKAAADTARAKSTSPELSAPRASVDDSPAPTPTPAAAKPAKVN